MKFVKAIWPFVAVAIVFMFMSAAEFLEISSTCDAPVKAQPAIKRLILLTKPGSCPRILIRCLMVNPPNRCLSDAQCPGLKKCCEGFCGKACMDPKGGSHHHHHH